MLGWWETMGDILKAKKIMETVMKHDVLMQLGI